MTPDAPPPKPAAEVQKSDKVQKAMDIIRKNRGEQKSKKDGPEGLSIRAFGPVSVFVLAGDWTFDKQLPGAQHSARLYRLKGTKCKVKLYSGPLHHTPEESSTEIQKLLKSNRELSKKEIAELPLLKERGNKSLYEVLSGEVKSLHGKQVIVVRGFWKEQTDKGLRMTHDGYETVVYVPEGKGDFHEIVFLGPKDEYQKNLSLFQKSLNAVVWKARII